MKIRILNKRYENTHRTAALLSRSRPACWLQFQMTREILRSEPTVKQHRKSGAAHSGECDTASLSTLRGMAKCDLAVQYRICGNASCFTCDTFFAMHTWQSPRCWKAANTIKFAVLELRNNRKSYMALSDAILIKIAILFFSVRVPRWHIYIRALANT